MVLGSPQGGEAVLSSQQESDLRDGAFGRDIRPFFRRAAKYKKVINGFELAVFPLRQSRAHKSLREYKVLDSISPNWEQKKEKQLFEMQIGFRGNDLKLKFSSLPKVATTKASLMEDKQSCRTHSQWAERDYRWG